MTKQDVLLSSVAERLGEAFCILDDDFRILYANPKMGALLGQPAEALVGQDLCARWYRFDGEDRPVDGRQILGPVVARGMTLEQVGAGFAVGDAPLPVELTASPLAREGERPGVALLARDVGERRRLERALRERARQHAEAEALAHVGHWEWWLESERLVCTDEFFRIFGLAPGSEVLTIERYLAMVHEEDRERVAQTLAQATVEGGLRYTARIVAPDGDSRTINVFGEAVPGPDGRPERVRGFVQDITDITRVDRALQQSRALFEAVFEHAGAGIVLMELDGTIVRANPTWAEIVGAAGVPAGADNFHEAILPAFRRRNEVLFAELIRDDNPRGRYALEAQLGRHAAEPVWANLVVSLIRDGQGEPHQAIAILEDITPRRQAEAELKEVKRRLARSRERAQLHLAQELHDGPMQDLYATQFLLEKLRRHVDPADRPTADTVLAALAQVNDTLRTIAGELRPPALAPFGLESAIRAYVDRFRERYPELQVHLDLMPDGQQLPEYVRLTLYRILQETLNNVAKHAGATHATVELALSDGTVLLEVRDDGQGFRVPARWIELARDNHLGLLGAAERADEIDGTLVVLSTPGKGTIVRVSVPRLSPGPEAGWRHATPEYSEKEGDR